MSFGEDGEILHDFLVEAGEILDQLSEQLVDLEQRPTDHDLLNAIFRGFHTVKGGAGFMQLEPMVECCHVTENLFDILRNGKREVTAELMDVVLEALDTINAQFQAVSEGAQVQRACQGLLDRLEHLVSCKDLDSTVAPTAAAAPAPADSNEGAVSGPSSRAASASAASGMKANNTDNDQITEDEFEALLDQLHGKGAGPGANRRPADITSTAGSLQSVAERPALDTPVYPGVSQPISSVSQASENSDDISDEEFESLLDQLHGPGMAPSKNIATLKSVPVSSPVQESISDDDFESLLGTLHGAEKSSSTTPGHNVAEFPSSPGNNKVAAAEPRKAQKPRKKDAGKSSQLGETTVRVDTQRLDDIMNMVGELVLVRNRLMRLGSDSEDEALAKAVANLDVVTGDLQSAVMQTRMQPIKKVFSRFPRVVRDLARSLKREIDLELIGEDTDLDKNLVDALADPLVHLVRNCVDHGIEPPEQRERAGKSRIGKVVLSAQQEGDHILLSISDDGAGMDPVQLREKAIEKGLFDADAAARLSDAEAFALIFSPGLSTKGEISDVSGRGVGMDVVKTKITQLNGSIEIQSKLGKGTRFNIKVPLTLAIMPTLMIMLGRQCFALPLVSVNEIFHMDLRKAHVVDGQECVTVRDSAIPLFKLKTWLVNRAVETTLDDEAHVVIMTVGTRRVGFVVDQLIGQEEVVIKPLGKMLHGTPGMAGATITGDGTIALILDVPSLLKRYAARV